MVMQMIHTQLLKVFSPRSNDQILAIECIEDCVSDIQNWMLQHRLKLNDNKTEVIIFGTKQQLAKLTCDQVEFGNDRIKIVDKVRNLGGTLDSGLTMEHHVNQLCKNSSHNLYNLRRIRHYLNQHTTEILVHALISSHLDNANSILYGMNNY